MHVLLTGAGQIGQALVPHLLAHGDTVTVLRAYGPDLPGTTTVRGDAGDRALLARLTASTPPDAVVHTVHAAYDHRVWRAELPPREQAVMDLATGLGIPVVFPESVYAWGNAARDLTEGAPVAPTTPLGQVRAELLAARAAHPARTLSIVAADLIGPTATTSGSVATALVVRPAAAGRRVWFPGDPDAPHALTHLPDLARALRHAAAHAEHLAPGGDAVIHAPTPPSRSMAALADAAATATGAGRARVTRLPTWPLAVAGLADATMRELHRMRYLWTQPSHLRPGTLTTEEGLAASAWEDVVAGGGDARSG
ncbi:NAD-dependent epimerase/dehydratase family protein [Kytococcus schroeteri]|nr:NAD-dependent epimerase/dehydratase family protein [Kytococcus schroeteri]